MSGDFSRVTFDPTKNIIQILKQQGRVDLDADWNEQSDILLHYIQTLARDLIGPHGGPKDGGFVLTIKGDDLMISRGRYYVEGLLCENHNDISYAEQPYKPKEKLKDIPNALVYLDVWKRHVTSFETSGFLEPALGGLDTVTRVQIVWQVKLLAATAAALTEKKCKLPLFEILKKKAKLRARTKQADKDVDPCNIEADARYRGAENQLYRVEVHIGNVDENGAPTGKDVTFKWSRENGSVIFPIVSIVHSSNGAADTTTVELADLGRDSRSTLNIGDIVEIIDDRSSSRNYYEWPAGDDKGALLKVTNIDSDRLSITLEGKTDVLVALGRENHPLLRRWDQKPGINDEGKEVYENGITLTEIKPGQTSEEMAAEKWEDLEDGVQIQFQQFAPGDIAAYRTGDYWLIPARTSIRDVDWPKDSHQQPIGQEKRGIEHYYAPLGLMIDGKVTDDRCRCDFSGGCPKDNPAAPHLAENQLVEEKAAIVQELKRKEAAAKELANQAQQEAAAAKEAAVKAEKEAAAAAKAEKEAAAKAAKETKDQVKEDNK
jgi:Family of unknown function (DUF6519)